MDFMQRSLDHDLTPEELDQTMRHLDGCPECSLMYERLSRLSEELTRMPKIEPPFSIVDSILPQLDLPEAVQTANPSSKPPVGWLHKLKDSISLRALGGVVAAGVLLTFIVNGMLPSKDDSSDSAMNQVFLRSSASNESASDSAADAGDAELYKVETYNTGETQQKQFAAGQPESEPVPDPSTDAEERSRAFEGLDQGEQDAPQPLEVGEFEQADPSSGKSPSAMDSGEPTVAPDTPDAFSAGSEEGGSMEHPPTIGAPHGGYGIASVPVEPAVTDSPDGSYEAVVQQAEEGQFVSITDPEGEIVMESSVHAEGELQVAWKSDTVLTVTVTTGDQATVYELDTETKEEKLAVSP
ncbi:zf-HC2 domain-containing protein [Marinicrinis lubricantis]|uniref:Anti-sigma-W factor RsiW n=1 Tax=Marinicrinis lubricantis TaxID=2086470 RepID=A0ABW1IUY2_9BACL